jgi:hypothetical protein
VPSEDDPKVKKYAELPWSPFHPDIKPSVTGQKFGLGIGIILGGTVSIVLLLLVLKLIIIVATWVF